MKKENTEGEKIPRAKGWIVLVLVFASWLIGLLIPQNTQTGVWLHLGLSITTVLLIVLLLKAYIKRIYWILIVLILMKVNTALTFFNVSPIIIGGVWFAILACLFIQLQFFSPKRTNG